jgi:hypothetical protein
MTFHSILNNILEKTNLNFVIEKHSSTEIPLLKERTISALKDWKYNRIKDYGDSITFRWFSMTIRTNISAAGKMSKGTMEFYSIGERNTIKLKYSISMIFQLIMVCTTTTFIITSPPLGQNKFFLAFSWIGIMSVLIAIQIIDTKLKAQRLLREIINEPVNQPPL